MRTTTVHPDEMHGLHTRLRHPQHKSPCYLFFWPRDVLPRSPIDWDNVKIRSQRSPPLPILGLLVVVLTIIIGVAATQVTTVQD